MKVSEFDFVRLLSPVVSDSEETVPSESAYSFHSEGSKANVEPSVPSKQSSCKDTDFLKKFQEFLQSSFGGNTDPPKSKEYSSVCGKFLKHFGAEDRISTAVKCLNARQMNEYIESHTSKRAAWRLNVLVCLVKLVTFLNHQQMVSSNFLSAFKASISGLRKTYSKQKTKDLISSQTQKRPKIMAVNLLDYFDAPVVRDATAALATACTTATEGNIKYIIATLLLNSGARTGAVSGLLIEEVLNGRAIKDGSRTSYVISISSHKTAYKGPVQVPLSVRESKALKIIALYALKRFPGALHPFLSAAGTPYTSSRVSREFSLAWTLSGMFGRYGKFYPTDNRKHFASVLGDRYPEMREEIAKQLKHFKEVERELYDLAEGEKIALKVADKMKDVGRERRAKGSATPLPPSPAASGQPSEGSSIPAPILMPAPRELPAPTPKRGIKRTRSLSPQRGDRLSLDKRPGSFAGNLSTDVPTTLPPVKKNKFDFIQDWVDRTPAKFEPLEQEPLEQSSASASGGSLAARPQSKQGLVSVKGELGRGRRRRSSTWTGISK